MPRKSRRLGPRWTIPGKLALKARWVANRPAMLARSKAGTEASRRTYAARLDSLKAFVASWPAQLTMQDIKGRIEADRQRGDRRSPDSIVRRMRDHDLITFDAASGLWQNLCRVALPDEPQNL
jgi:hypothetical protein